MTSNCVEFKVDGKQKSICFNNLLYKDLHFF